MKKGKERYLLKGGGAIVSDEEIFIRKNVQLSKKSDHGTEKRKGFIERLEDSRNQSSKEYVEGRARFASDGGNSSQHKGELSHGQISPTRKGEIQREIWLRKKVLC